MEVRTEAGFHCSDGPGDGARNARIRRAFEAWLPGFLPSPLLRSGELCTVLPYLWNPKRGGGLTYERVWVEASDRERVASDWVFPPGGYDPDRPVVLLLTGLAPSKHWTRTGGFIADAAWHLSTRKGMTAVVVVARGTMDTEVREHLFHGARVTDLREVILTAEKALLASLGTEQASHMLPPIFAAGYSMGAIILGNYCGKFGSDARLRGAIHFSGIYDAVANMRFEYSTKVWQAYLLYNLKRTFCTGRALQEAIRRGVDVRRVQSRHVSSIVGMDSEFVAVFNGYKDVLDYYRDLSLWAEDKWKSVAVPLLAVSARDDPITHCDALRASELSAGNGNLLFLITERGGHVGWPCGLRPWRLGFDFMNEAIAQFVESVLSDS